MVKQYSLNPFLKHVIVQPYDYHNFQIEDRLIYLVMDEERLSCMPEFQFEGHSFRELITSQVHSIIVHLSSSKTLQYIRASFRWKSMVSDIDYFCKTCSTCVMNRSTSQQPMGKLCALPVPSYPWQSIGIDFFGPLPASLNCLGRYNMLYVIIYHFTSMVHLVPTQQTTTAEAYGGSSVRARVQITWTT